MIRFVVAVLAGIALGPMVLVFSPVYFPWTLLTVVAAGLLVGIADGGTLAARLAWSSLAAALLFAVATFALSRMNAGFMSVRLLAWLSLWLLMPSLLGVAVGALARERLGPLRGMAASAGGVATVALIGAALALVAAPPEVANAPACGSTSYCDRWSCSMMAERRGWLAVERVTSYDAGGITCVYTGWGGIRIGTVVSAGRGSSWEDGWWPRLLRTWNP